MTLSDGVSTQVFLETFETAGSLGSVTAYTAPRVAFRVDGEAATAGSKTLGITNDGRPFARPSRGNAAKTAYMDEVKRQAHEAMDAAGLETLRGPLRLDLTVFRTRPRSHFGVRGLNATGKRNPYPATRPDVDKLARAVCDRMKGIVYADDGQIVLLVAAKHWGTSSFVQVEIRALA